MSRLHRQNAMRCRVRTPPPQMITESPPPSPENYDEPGPSRRSHSGVQTDAQPGRSTTLALPYTWNLFSNLEPIEEQVSAEEQLTSPDNSEITPLVTAEDETVAHITATVYRDLEGTIFDFIPAIIAFDRNQTDKVHEKLNTCLAKTRRVRRKLTLRGTITNFIRPNHATYTDNEAQAELVHAEVLLVQTGLIILEGVELTGVVNSTLKIRNCYKSYKECAKILSAKQWESRETLLQFQSGTIMGRAIYNVLITLLPPKIISILQIVGCAGNKNTSLEVLLIESRSTGPRSIICSFALLCYYLIVAQFIGAKINFDVCEEIITRETRRDPESLWFLLFNGRYHFLRREHDIALQIYHRVLNLSPENDIIVRHLCMWELMWLSAVNLDWCDAVNYANVLCLESNWSKTIYYYAKGSWLLMLDYPPEIWKDVIDECFRNVISYQQENAERSIPIERFMALRAARYQDQQALLAPGLELLGLWNMFPLMLRNKACTAANKLYYLNRQMSDGLHNEIIAGYEGENYALVRYLEGAVLTAAKLPRMALEVFTKIDPDYISEDIFILLFAECDIGYDLYLIGKNFALAYDTLTKLSKRYSGYLMETRLHFKLQARIAIVKAVLDGDEEEETVKS